MKPHLQGDISCRRRCHPPRSIHGASIVKTLALILALLILMPLLALAIFESRKAYWDNQVRMLCEKDGGMAVYELVAISRSQFLAWGGKDGIRGVPIPHESEKRNDVPIYRRTSDEVIHSANPAVRRSVTEFVRRSDGNVLGRYIYYARRGGDFPTWAHESSFGCTQSQSVSQELFVIGRGPQ